MDWPCLRSGSGHGWVWVCVIAYPWCSNPVPITLRQPDTGEEQMTKRSKTSLREAETAAKNRRELIAAQLTRRDMMKMGLLTSAGYLIPKHGLSARPKKSDGGHDNTPVSPPTRSFIEPLAIMPVAQPVSSLSPAPTVCPNT